MWFALDRSARSHIIRRLLSRLTQPHETTRPVKRSLFRLTTTAPQSHTHSDKDLHVFGSFPAGRRTTSAPKRVPGSIGLGNMYFLRFDEIYATIFHRTCQW